MNIIPPGVTFKQALRFGYAGRIECRPYLDWIKEQPCVTCGAPGPSDPSHLNGWKGMGTKSPDLMVLPQCRRCHEDYEIDGLPEEQFLADALFYIVQAFYEGHLVWKS